MTDLVGKCMNNIRKVPFFPPAIIDELYCRKAYYLALLDEPNSTPACPSCIEPSPILRITALAQVRPDVAQVIPLSYFDATITQDIVGRNDVEIKIRD